MYLVLELLVAVGVIILGLFGLASVYTFGTLAGKESEESLVAHRYACQLVDHLRASNMAFESGFPPYWTEEVEPGLVREKEAALDAAPFAAIMPPDTELKRTGLLEMARASLIRLSAEIG